MSQAKKKPSEQGPELLVGARAIAWYLFQNEGKARWVYERWREFGCFLWRGQIVGRPETIKKHIVAREARVKTTMKRIKE
jgi:hypothetical protein